jgi:putative FmdB family regulatory protein
MPIYEYQCAACDYYLEVMQKISDGPLKKCPSCGRSRLKRLISAPVFRLKGSGWYETDFKSDKEGKRNLAGSADREDAIPAAATETAAAAKPETTTPTAAPAKPTAAAPTESGTGRGRTTKVTATAKRAVRRPAPKPKRGRKR